MALASTQTFAWMRNGSSWGAELSVETSTRPGGSRCLSAPKGGVITLCGVYTTVSGTIATGINFTARIEP